MAVDSSLHVSAKPYVDAGSMTLDEARGRSVTFWGVFSTDRMWSLYLGRPSLNLLQAISIETPSAFEVPTTCFEPRIPQTVQENPIDLQGPVVEQWIGLLRIRSALEGLLYFQADASNVELQHFANSTWERLELWRRELPRELDLDFSVPSRCSAEIIVLQYVLLS
ncbi:uncharacterized protein FRV6_15362 [Fusarium oxysporum]|uniref:Xylanolytic transcriptional activator regulatory domain-containing protein n=1 Tax=Fusarium oxysporum TaxID=5507 RepID=A0A2H3TRI8_FUSOX|nr:uncharacterized protein FRV6_15362 [Fusarium oxysporum]